MYNVFIDGREGTTGLQIYDRLMSRKDIRLLSIPEELRKVPRRAKSASIERISSFCAFPTRRQKRRYLFVKTRTRKSSTLRRRTGRRKAGHTAFPNCPVTFARPWRKENASPIRLPRQRLHLPGISFGERRNRVARLSVRRAFGDGIQRRGQKDDRFL